MTKLYVSYFNGKYPSKFKVREFSKKEDANIFIKEIRNKGGKASFTQTCFGAEKEYKVKIKNINDNDGHFYFNAKTKKIINLNKKEERANG